MRVHRAIPRSVARSSERQTAAPSEWSAVFILALRNLYVKGGASVPCPKPRSLDAYEAPVRLLRAKPTVPRVSPATNDILAYRSKENPATVLIREITKTGDKWSRMLKLPEPVTHTGSSR